LKQAGIEEATAFETSASLVDTLTRLQVRDIEVPWAMPTHSLDVLLNLTSWVWGSGGHVRTSDGRRLRLGEPEAQAGVRAYFDLHCFLSPPARALNTMETDRLFYQGKVAAVISGPWLLRLLAQDGTILPQVGVAPVPGVPYVGGTNLVIWQHTTNERAAIELMQHLTSPRVQRHSLQETGFLPSRIEILNDEPFVSDPLYKAFARSLKSGRVLNVLYRWAAVEQRLVNMLSQLWADLADDPKLDLKSEIAGRLTALSLNLEQTLFAAW
jgi:ABC-type glycerol-3-phosphate transport system substrate-binding protein